MIDKAAIYFSPNEALQRVIEHREIMFDEMVSLAQQFMNGEVPPVQMAGIIVGLRVKKETVSEIAAMASVMRKLATHVPVASPESLLDIVGTGGDGARTFNISTASMFVAAAAGARVAKHGGRSVSSQSGSADVLEALGVNINMTPAQVAESIEKTGVGFMFAPNHHSAMKHVAPVRKELGVRTIFNILGPLTNPAGAANQLMGVFHPDLVAIQANVLRHLGCHRAMIVYGESGLDEISLSGSTLVGEVLKNEVLEYKICPEDFGFDSAPMQELQVNSPEESKSVLQAVLANETGAARDVVCLNSGASLYVLGQAKNIAEGVAQASAAISSGAARQKLADFVAFTQSCNS